MVLRRDTLVFERSTVGGQGKSCFEKEEELERLGNTRHVFEVRPFRARARGGRFSS